jgi:Tol biopolymer transport system component
MSVDQLERRFRQLKAQLQAGTIGQEQFELEVQRLQYRDPRGLYWTIGAQTGQWYMYDGAAWVPRQPPVSQPPPAAPPSAVPPGVPRGPVRRRRSQPVLTIFSCLGLFFILGIAIAGVAIIGTIAAQIARPTPPALSLATPGSDYNRFGAPEVPAAAPVPTLAPTDTPVPVTTPTETATPLPLVLTPTLTATLPISGTEPGAAAAMTTTVPAEATEEVVETLTAEEAPAPAEPTDTPVPEEPQPALTGIIAYSVFGWDPMAKTNSFQIFLLGADGSGSTRYASNASQPSLSADGNLITYKQWSTDNVGLVAGGVSGGSFSRLTDKFEDALPSLSPDGNSVVMFSRRDGQRKSILYPMTSGGFTPDGDMHGISDGEYPFWMPDGRILFKGWGVTGQGLRIMNPDGSGVIPLTQDGSDTAPAASRDASTIAFMSARDGDWEIYKINVDGSGLTRLTEDHAADGLPAWSPDGRSIAFVSDRGDQWAIWVMNADGSNQRKLHDIEGTPDALVPGQPDYVTKGWLEERLSWGGQ